MKNQLQRNLKGRIALVAICVFIGGMASRGHAASVLKLSLGASESGNMQFANGVFSMLGDDQANTPGDHNVSIDFVIGGGPASQAIAPGGSASVSLAGMTALVPPTNNGSFVVQAFGSGSLAIYDLDNALLLSGNLSKSGIQGALGPGDKQALFLGFGKVTGGSLAPFLDPDSLQLRIKFPKISGGFSVSSPPDPLLNPFTTWTSSIEIMATQIPEPTIALTLSALAWMLAPARRRPRA